MNPAAIGLPAVLAVWYLAATRLDPGSGYNRKRRGHLWRYADVFAVWAPVCLWMLFAVIA